MLSVQLIAWRVYIGQIELEPAAACRIVTEQGSTKGGKIMKGTIYLIVSPFLPYQRVYKVTLGFKQVGSIASHLSDFGTVKA